MIGSQRTPGRDELDWIEIIYICNKESFFFSIFLLLFCFIFMLFFIVRNLLPFFFLLPLLVDWNLSCADFNFELEIIHRKWILYDLLFLLLLLLFRFVGRVELIGVVGHIFRYLSAHLHLSVFLIYDQHLWI